MTDFLKWFEENSNTFSDKEIMADGLGQRLTYHEVYDLSSRVYAYLKKNGIGKEDFVFVCLPRGAFPLICALGVLRAGAAFVLTEDDIPAERLEYIRIDCCCKLEINQACWEEILKMEPLSGYEERNPHSAAFAVYTSGTTGKPKGVLHEYGNIDRIINSSIGVATGEDRFVLCNPLNFVFSVVSLFFCMVEGIFIYVIPFAVLKDPAQLQALLVEEKITVTFISPMFAKKLAPLLKSLHCCLVGSEPASELYSEDYVILNGYTMSEVGFIVAVYKVDKLYENTPVGNSICGYPVRLLGDDGKEVSAGQKGEIVIENPFVRGYIHMPEKTAAVFKDGWYHTGDLGMWDDEKRLVICGRLDDMEKVNGNRIEPGEIEVVACKTLKLSWAAAKVFHDHEKVEICLYYIDPVQIDPDQAKETLSKQLPYYMVPAFFVHIDQIPLTFAGKFNRRALPLPNLNEDRAAYVAPESDVQKALCDAFCKVFHVTPVGIDDDFTQLGGDSLDVMAVVVASHLEGLSAADVLMGKTPKGIEALYLSHGDQQDVEQANAEALKKNYPLTADQAYTTEWQLKEKDSTMRSIHTLMKFNKQVIDLNKMAIAITVAMRNHPALFTELYYDEAGNLRQRFSSDLLKDVVLEKLTEAEFAKVKETLVQPFTMINTPLFRARVFETEAFGYIFVDVHHTVFDGNSYGILLADIMAAYQGKELAKDYYPYILDTQGCLSGSDAYEANKAYFEEKYGQKDWCRHLDLVAEAKDSAIGIDQSELPITKEQLSLLEKKKGISKNGFFAIVTALATSMVTKKKDIMLFWTFNGRMNSRELHTVGSLRSRLPLALTIDEQMTFEELCESVNAQVSAGMVHSRYAYLEEHPEMLDEGVIRVLYQGAMENNALMPGFVENVPLEHVNTVSRAFINLEINDINGKLSLTLKHTASCFRVKEMNQFNKFFNSAVTVLANHIEDDSLLLSTVLKEMK